MASGRLVDLRRPRAVDIELADIVHALSRIQRFGGALSADHFSVADHSLLVASLSPQSLAPWSLLHDAAEAYVGDASTPLKALVPQLGYVEADVMGAIVFRFNLTWPQPAEVTRADLIATTAEAMAFLPPHRWQEDASPDPALSRALVPQIRAAAYSVAASERRFRHALALAGVL